MTMTYVFLGTAAVLVSYFFLNKKLRIQSIKRNGIKTMGSIIKNNEQQNSRFQLGGNINEPTVRFFTNEGKEIVGKPVVGFISQEEVKLPRNVRLVYNSKNPEKFYLELE